MTTHTDRHPRGILGSAIVVPASKGRNPRPLPRMAAISSRLTSLSASRQENPPQPRLRKHSAKRTKHIAGIVQAASRNQTLPESPESEEPKKVDELKRKKELYKCTYTRVHTCTHTLTHIPDTTWNSLDRIYTALLQGRTRWTGWYRLRCVPIIRGRRFGRLWIPSIYAHKARRFM